MNQFQKTGFAERLKTAAEARKALLAQFKPRPAVISPDLVGRSERRKAELVQVRAERIQARLVAKQAVADGEEAVRQAAALADEEALAVRRGERKARKKLTEAEAKAARDARYAARKAR